jgi:DNA-directed RNA polymerase subunit E'/Rpb7
MLLQINQKVSLESKYLDGDLETHILNKLCTSTKDKCSFETGYIIDVIKIIKIGENTISSVNTLTVFNITYEAEVLKPTEGLIVSGNVCMIFQHGVFVDIKNKMKVLIPATTIKDFSYNSEKSSFSYMGKNVVQNDDVNIEIVMIKYEKKQFSCIGKLKKILKA